MTVFGFSGKGLFEQLKTFDCTWKALQEVSFCVHDVECVPYCHGTVCPWVGDARDSPHLWSVVVKVVDKQLREVISWYSSYVRVGCRETTLKQETSHIAYVSMHVHCMGSK